MFSKWTLFTMSVLECRKKRRILHRKIPKVILIQVHKLLITTFWKMSRKIHLNYLYKHIHMLEKCIPFIISVREKKAAKLMKTSLLWISMKKTRQMCCATESLKGVLSAKERENGCVNDPIPSGHIQFISSTSRSIDSSSFQSTLTNFRSVFFSPLPLFIFKRVFYFVFLYWWNNSLVSFFHVSNALLLISMFEWIHYIVV